MIQPLRTAGEFRTLRATGHRATEGPITMIASAVGNLDRSRVAYAIPRRVGTAVHRNRLRRRIRAVLVGFDRAGTLPTSRYLVICSPAAVALDHSHLTSCLQGAIDRLSSAA